MSEKEIKVILKQFDKNKDGKLSFKEIMIMLVDGLKKLIEEGKLDAEKLIQEQNIAATKIQSRYRGNKTRKGKGNKKKLKKLEEIFK